MASGIWSAFSISPEEFKCQCAVKKLLVVGYVFYAPSTPDIGFLQLV